MMAMPTELAPEVRALIARKQSTWPAAGMTKLEIPLWRNPKHEIPKHEGSPAAGMTKHGILTRAPKEARSPNDELTTLPTVLLLRASSFLRDSSFVIRHFHPWLPKRTIPSACRHEA